VAKPLLAAREIESAQSLVARADDATWNERDGGHATVEMEQLLVGNCSAPLRSRTRLGGLLDLGGLGRLVCRDLLRRPRWRGCPPPIARDVAVLERHDERLRRQLLDLLLHLRHRDAEGDVERRQRLHRRHIRREPLDPIQLQPQRRELRQLRDAVGQRRDLVVVQLQPLELRQRAHHVGKLGERVLLQVQLRELRELRWQLTDLVALELERLERNELAELRRHVLDPALPQIQGRQRLQRADAGGHRLERILAEPEDAQLWRLQAWRCAPGGAR
jgi:hypothetical protein